jgi:hypothetical protein
LAIPREIKYAEVVHLKKSTHVGAFTKLEIPATIATTIEATIHQTHSALPGIGKRAPAGQSERGVVISVLL